MHSQKVTWSLAAGKPEGKEGRADELNAGWVSAAEGIARQDENTGAGDLGVRSCRAWTERDPIRKPGFSR